jgi:hypothetical protein
MSSYIREGPPAGWKTVPAIEAEREDRVPRRRRRYSPRASSRSKPTPA